MNDEEILVRIKRNPTHYFLLSAQNELYKKTGKQHTQDETIMYCLQKALGGSNENNV